jgi:hypothetical protein
VLTGGAADDAMPDMATKRNPSNPPPPQDAPIGAKGYHFGKKLMKALKSDAPPRSDARQYARFLQAVEAAKQNDGAEFRDKVRAVVAAMKEEPFAEDVDAILAKM